MSTATKVKERPILFSGPMVRAILDGCKTQTRRVLKPQPTEKPDGRWSWIASSSERGEQGKFQYSWPDPDGNAFTIRGREQAVRVRCPYGSVGDRLWVRETCWSDACSVYYTADNSCQSYSIENPIAEERLLKLHHYAGGVGDKVPSIHMPRWASRINLEIVEVAVQRVREISREDAIAEGIFLNDNDWWDAGNGLRGELSPEAAFRELWASINGSESWTNNPWVWVIKFKRSSGD